jgi:2,3-bisphosphoglycerate-dependent phosphoglycerate mutase
MKMTFKICLFLLVGLVAMSWGFPNNQPAVTTFILVRHGEKNADTSGDPDLNSAGIARAQRLASMLKETKVDAVFSTNYKRTKNTVTPLAESKNMYVQLYQPNKPEPVDEMLTKYSGGTIVISGHSNTIPWFANYLTGKEEMQNFADDDFDNLLVVSVIAKGNAKVIWLTY